MNNCIFAAHCTEQICDKSCPIFTETSYLLERNNINMSNPVFNADYKDIRRAISVLKVSEGAMKVVVSNDNTNAIANLITYASICENWQGSRLHCNVYHLRFSNHVDSIQKSWNVKSVNDSLEYEQIWCQTAKVLIISNIDFVQFKDFQAQTLLNIVTNRRNDGLTTIIVSPQLDTLIGSGAFFQRMKILFEGSVITW